MSFPSTVDCIDSITKTSHLGRDYHNIQNETKHWSDQNWVMRNFDCWSMCWLAHQLKNTKRNWSDLPGTNLTSIGNNRLVCQLIGCFCSACSACSVWSIYIYGCPAEELLRMVVGEMKMLTSPRRRKTVPHSETSWHGRSILLPSQAAPLQHLFNH